MYLKSPKKTKKKVNSYILRVGSGIKDRLESEIQVDSDSDWPLLWAREKRHKIWEWVFIWVVQRGNQWKDKQSPTRYAILMNRRRK